MIHEELNHKLDEYVRGKLSAEEREEVELLIKQNPDIKKEVDTLKVIRAGITLHERQAIKKHLQQIEPEARQFKWWYVAAAIVPLLLLSIWYFYPVSSENIYYAYYSSYPNYEAGISRNENTTTDGRTAAFINYEKTNYEEAAAQFLMILERNPDDNSVKFYLALCYLELNLTGMAADYLNAVMNDTQSTYREAAHWYYALTQLKLGNKVEAKEALTALENNGSYQKQAKEILSKLK
ncbi:MAG TPA: hypothetical protein PKC24_12305 [Cyclobacteriaceae bacterium]|nr:hypothetical protein [Cyclobacteriaceae bacterium]